MHENVAFDAVNILAHRTLKCDFVSAEPMLTPEAVAFKIDIRVGLGVSIMVEIWDLKININTREEVLSLW